MRFSNGLTGSMIAAVLACAATGPAIATEHQIDISNSPSPTVTMRATEFHLLDLDHDGFINLSDVTDPVTRSQFPSLDRNHDQRLSEKEFLALK